MASTTSHAFTIPSLEDAALRAEFLGWNAQGGRVFRYNWTGAELVFALTTCCAAAYTGAREGVVCKECREVVEDEDVVVVVPAWCPTCGDWGIYCPSNRR